jgi:hypothetical protein
MHEPGMPVTVTIDGQEHPIRFSLRTLKTLQKDHGIALLRASGADLVDPEKLALVLYHGLREHDPAITLDWVEDHVDAASLIGMIPSLSHAISGQQPKQREVPNALTPGASGTGSPSGQLDDTTSTLVNGRSGV